MQRKKLTKESPKGTYGGTQAKARLGELRTSQTKTKHTIERNET